MQHSLPKKIESIWIATTPKTNYPTLEKDLEVDVAVIGGGIVGLNTAYFLKNQGLKVAIIEAGKIVTGTSGNTTAKITSLHSLRYDYLTKTQGVKKAQIYADSHQWAIFEFKRIIQREGIDCDFYRAPSFTYTKSEDGLQEIKDEVNAALNLGLPASFVTVIPEASLKILGAVRFENQAYFHPRKYLLKIAELINKDGGYIFETTTALDIKESDDWCMIKTTQATIKTKSVVMATNFPFYDPGKIFSKLQRQGSFVIAASPTGFYPDAMFIGTKSLDMSFRPHKDKEKAKDWLIVGARHEETLGGRSMDESFKLLAQIVEEKFSIESVDYKWGAADTYSLDKVAYIGKLPGSKKIYVATGFSAWGMTTSLVSAKLFTDLILGVKNEWESLYSPARLRR